MGRDLNDRDLKDRDLKDRDELYIGYLPQTPAGIARFLRLAVPLLVLLVVALGLLLPILHRPFDPGVFEFGQTRELAGWIEEHPYPTLLTTDTPGGRRGAATAADGEREPGELSRLLLVMLGKHGADDAVAGLGGHAVRVRGTLIERAPQRMLELSDEPSGDPQPPSPTLALIRASEPLGEVTVRGEIVDSKCFLGVMKPGRGKPHRSCAARCISGGVPPALYVRDRDGNERFLLLVDSAGEPLAARVLTYVGEPIEITGQLEQRGETLYLRADPGTYRRVGGS